MSKVQTKLRVLRRLACGEPTGGSPLEEVVRHLGATLEALTDEVAMMSTEFPADDLAARRIVLYGPFVGRSVLEIVATSLIGRLDPFRVLALRQIQMQPAYVLSRRTRAAIQWSGDVISEEGRVEKPWSGDRDLTKMTRALLGDYQDHVVWRPAFERFMDEAPADRGGEWMRSLRRIAPDGFLPSVRARFENAFSECSKGVHHELLIPPARFFTPETVRELLHRVLEVTAILSAVFNVCDHAAYRLTVEQAVADLESIQEPLGGEGIV